MDLEITETLPLLPTETGGTQTGKDEMNLAEFPFAVLSKRVAEGQKTIEVVQEGRDAQGRPLQQEWLVTGSDRFGLPVAADDEVYVALMKLLRDSHFTSRTVRFTIAQLLRIMRSGVGKRDYERVEQSLDRLTGVLLRSKNAFWSHASKRHVTEAFHLLDSYRLARGGGCRELSEVTFSEFLFSSIQSGYVKNLDIDFYFSLSTPLARRYYRLLDKHRHRGHHYEVEIRRLAQKLPLQDTYESQLRRRLDPVHAEFLERGFLESADYRKATGGSTVVCLQFVPRAIGARPVADAAEDGAADRDATIPERASPPAAPSPGNGLEAALIAAGVSRKIAAELTQAYPAEEIAQQLAYLPYVTQLKNPGGYLRQAIEHGYGPPPGWNMAQEQEKDRRAGKRSRIKPNKPADALSTRGQMEAVRGQGQGTTELEAARVTMQADPALWEQIAAEAKQRMPKILRDRPQNPAYGATMQVCLDAVVSERTAIESVSSPPDPVEQQDLTAIR